MRSRSFRIDLHTHSIASPDGGLRLQDYKDALEAGQLDYIAITDHDRIDFALEAQQQLGERIIVGEEISTTDGEVIGLFLKEQVPPGLGLAETVTQIQAQGGLVYVPHPFETVRSGVSAEGLATIADAVAIIETYNGRAIFQDKGADAQRWAQTHDKATAASSDAHGRFGWRKTYSIVSQEPTAANLVELLRLARYATKRVGLGILYPKLNRIRNKQRDWQRDV